MSRRQQVRPRSGRKVFTGSLSSIEPNEVEIRILGCLVEKQRTTPDAYPLTLNALRLACNQATNRAPVVDYDEATITEALGRLRERRWVRVASMPGRRTLKYRHLLDDALGLDDRELAVLAVLMLRGPQTPGEIKQRSERLHPTTEIAAINSTLERLAERGLVTRHERRPGEKQARYEQLLGGVRPDDLQPADSDRGPADESPSSGELATRLDRVEEAIEALRAELAAVRAGLDAQA